MLLSRKRRKLDKTGERIAREIYSEFEIKIAATTNVFPPSTLFLNWYIISIYQFRKKKRGVTICISRRQISYED